MKLLLLACLFLGDLQAYADSPIRLKPGNYISAANWPACRAKAKYDANGLKKLVLAFESGPMQMSCSGNTCTQDEPGSYNYTAIILSRSSFLLKDDRWALSSRYTLEHGH